MCIVVVASQRRRAIGDTRLLTHAYSRRRRHALGCDLRTPAFLRGISSSGALRVTYASFHVNRTLGHAGVRDGD